MTHNDELMQLQRSITENKRLIELSATLQRLEKNPDFKAIIEQGYFKDEAIRLVHLKADAAMQADIRQAAIVKEIDAIGSLSSYLRYIKTQGDIAEKSLSHDEDTYAELAFITGGSN